MITAEIRKVSQGIAQGELIVWASYESDGVPIQSAYVCANGEIRSRAGELLGTYTKEENLDGEQLWCTRYDAIQLQGIDDVNAYILDQSQQFVNQIIRRQYSQKANADLVASLSADLVGQTVQADTVTVDVSPTQQMTIKQDGTKGLKMDKVQVNPAVNIAG